MGKFQNDAAAICEAVTCPSMRFVATKFEQQQSGLMLHRSRQLLVCQRTMLSNAIRGHMAELGIISAKGRNGTAELFKIIANEQDDRIPAAARFSLDVLARQYAAVRAEIVAIEKRIHAWHRSSEESRRLEEIPGVGPIDVIRDRVAAGCRSSRDLKTANTQSPTRIAIAHCGQHDRPRGVGVGLLC
jgi:transposase